MELKDYINSDKIDKETPPPVVRKKRKPTIEDEVKPIVPATPIPEMTDDECLQFYTDLSNMAYMAINPKLRPIATDEVQPVKTAAGNVIRTLMRYLGDYRFYFDAVIMTGFTVGIYKQRKAELTSEIDNAKKNTDI